MINQRLEKQIQFIIEVDQVKQIFRKNYLMDNSRRENDAEHSWHLALMAMALSEHVNAKKLDLLKVFKMVIIHDLVEIKSGDRFAYSEQENKGKKESEEKAAHQLFGMLPAEQREEMLNIWHEFEAMETNEARFAAALDRLQPLLHNYKTQASGWENYRVTREDVLKRNQDTRDIAPALWQYIKKVIAEMDQKGYFSALY